MTRSALALLFAAVLPAAAEVNAPKPDLSFMTGHWRTAVWGGVGDEIWSAPLDGNLIGMWRFVKDGKLVFTEFLTAEASAQGTSLWMRHFHPQLRAWEEKEKAIEWRVAAAKPNDVLFESGSARLRYRLESADVLVTTLEKTKDGKVETTTFRFARVK